MAQRRSSSVTADFPGAASPVGSVIRFRADGRRELSARVTCLRRRHAEAVTADGEQWKVPYLAILAVENPPAPERSLSEVERRGNLLLGRHQAAGTLGAGWTFGFDLATTRAGVCRYRDKRIDLSVSYCLAASPEEVEDTILHEIAHAIVGPQHNHDAVWKAKAREIGCAGERCHRVQHSAPKWVGECGCGQRWFRHVLQRRMMSNRVCARCRGAIAWRKNTDASAPPV